MAKLPPHLVSAGKEHKACSKCGQIVEAKDGKTLSTIFLEHVRAVHLANVKIEAPSK